MPSPSSSTFEENISSYNRLAGKLCRTHWQLYFSGVISLFILYAQIVATNGSSPPFKDAPTFHTFLFGIGSICAIIAPLTFGFLIQQGQKVHGEKIEMFIRYQDLVIELRKYLKDLYDTKGVTNLYTEFLSSLEITKSSDFDGPPTAFYWWPWAAMGLIRWMEDEAASEATEVDFDEVHHGLMPQLLIIEELLGSIQINAIQRAVIHLILVEPVINLFWIIVVVVVLAIASSIHCDGVVVYAYYFGLMFASTFMMLIVFQLGRYARYEAKFVMSER